jgi:HK97 family phage portal protein
MIKLIDRFRGAGRILLGRSKAKGAVTHPQDILDDLQRGQESDAGVEVNALSAMRVAAVNACVRVISESLASAPLRIFTRTDIDKRAPALDHPLWPLLHEGPNEYQTIFEFIEMLSASVLLRGNGYAFINRMANPRTGKEFIGELLPLHPDYVEVSVDRSRALSYRVRLDDTGSEPPVVLSARQVFHLRGLSSNGYLGLNPIALARETIGGAIAQQRYGARLFKNGTKLSGVLEHPGELNQDSADRIRESWERMYSGVDNAHRTAVLEEGMKYKEISMTAEDSQFSDARKLSRQDIASIYRVPLHKIGDLSGATFSNIEHQNIEFVSNCLLPWARRWELAVTRDLIEAPRVYYPRFGLDVFLRGDTTARYAAYAVGRQWGWLSANDIRALEEMNPIEGGNTYLSPMNMIPADLLDDYIGALIKKLENGGEIGGNPGDPALGPGSEKPKKEDVARAVRTLQLLTR